ncbi:hypothetical protein SME13J_23360 [Serratia marcescens]|nr:hypothetical protein SME13J_23360 [Serratia marcescens]
MQKNRCLKPTFPAEKMLSLTAYLETNLLHKIGFSLFMAYIRSLSGE